MATPRTTKRYGRAGGSATKRQPEQMTLMSSFLNARDGSSPGLTTSSTTGVRASEKAVSSLDKKASAKIDFGGGSNSGVSSKSPSLGRVTKPDREVKGRPTLLRKTRGASIFDIPVDSDDKPEKATTSSANTTEKVQSATTTGRASTRAKRGSTTSTGSSESPDSSKDDANDSSSAETPKTKRKPSSLSSSTGTPVIKKTATPTAKGKTTAKRPVATPPTKVRLTRSRSRSASPAVLKSAEKEDSLMTSSSISNGSSNGVSPRSSQTLFSSEVGVTGSQQATSTAIDLEDTPSEAQAEAPVTKEKDDGNMFGPKRLFASSDSSGLSGTPIFASAQKRKIKQMRTSTPTKKSSKKEHNEVKTTPSSSFASSFESSQNSQEPVRAPISVTTNKRTYGANRSYLADSPTKKDNIYTSIMSESSDESEKEELNIKSVHELRETGGNARFMDEMEYLAEGLEDEGSSRRTTLLEICKKAKEPEFIRKLKTTDYADKILHVLPQVVETDQVASFLVLFIAQKIFGDNGANVLDTVINDPKFLDSIFLCLDNTDSILRDKKSSKVFQKVLKEFVDGTTSASDEELTPSPALAAIATLSTLQTYPGASGSTILKACLQPANWDKFKKFAINAFEEKEYKVLQLVVFFLDFCQSDIFFPHLAIILDELSAQLQKKSINNTLVDLSLPVLRLLIVYTNEHSIPELDGSFVLKCIALAETLNGQSEDSKLYEVYLLCLGFLENIIGELTTDYQKVYDIFSRLARGNEDKHCQAFLTLLRKNVATRGGLKLSAKDKAELE